MEILNKLKGLFSKIFRKNNNMEFNFLNQNEVVEELPMPKTYEPIELPEGELVSFSDEIIDTDSRISEEKLKHNLEILMKKAKETGKVDKFMLIREDDFFPSGWEWRVLSKNTNLEKEHTILSYELKLAYALEQSNINPYNDISGNKIYYVPQEKRLQALSQVDKTFGSILLPSRFRSTKHFTINTPLGITGNYNNVPTDRDYIIIDDINMFLKSEYGYSVSYHDAYLDISHESLPISNEAIVLINEENYDRIMSDEKIARELTQRKIVRFKGDEIVAINMVLTEIGVLPSDIGYKYAYYDKEIRDILDESIKSLAKENGLFFDKSHAGELKPDGGHFSNYYDGKNEDYENAIIEFIYFLKQKFPEHEELFPEYLKFTENNSRQIIEKIGINNLVEAINEYNELASDKVKKTLLEYMQDRQNITPEIHQRFVETIALINNFYKNTIQYESYEIRKKTEEAIQKFIQGETVKEQLEASKVVWELLLSKDISKTETIAENGTITMKQIITNAITKGISTEHVEKSDTEYKNLEFQIQTMGKGDDTQYDK